jgi:recombination protein RecA
MEENPKFTEEIQQLVRSELAGGAVVSANSVAPVDAQEDEGNSSEEE